MFQPQTLLVAVLLAIVSIPVFAVCPPPADTWSQVIENDDSGSETRYSPSYYYTNWSGICDNDSNDMEYVIVYRLNYSCDPDGLRYDNGSNWHNGSLKVLSYTSTDDDVHVCIGTGIRCRTRRRASSGNRR